MEAFSIGSIAGQYTDALIRAALEEKGFDSYNTEFLKNNLTRICFTYNYIEHYYIKTVHIISFDWSNLFVPLSWTT